MVLLGGENVALAANPVVEDGQFHLRLHFQYLPTSTEIASLRTTVERARAQFCDATGYSSDHWQGHGVRWRGQ